MSESGGYVHLTSNETIDGIQYKSFPDTGDVPLFADMSSDILSRPIEASKFTLIYAGAQKNIGPTGVTIVIVRRSLLERITEAATSRRRIFLLISKRGMAERK